MASKNVFTLHCFWSYFSFFKIKQCQDLEPRTHDSFECKRKTRIACMLRYTRIRFFRAQKNFLSYTTLHCKILRTSTSHYRFLMCLKDHHEQSRFLNFILRFYKQRGNSLPRNLVHFWQKSVCLLDYPLKSSWRNLKLIK